MSRPHKRQKVIKLGAPQEDDSDLPTPHSQANAPSSAAWSRRELSYQHPPSLALLSMRIFALNLSKLSSEPTIWEFVRQQLKELPSALVPRLFETLRELCPGIINHAMMTAYFLHGPSVVLTDELSGVNKLTISAIGSSSNHSQLVELQLRKLEKMPDDLIASTVNKLPSLKILNLRECIKVGPKTADAAGKSCPQLTVVNLSYTAVTPVSLTPILKNCKGLEVLKLAGIPNWTDATVSKLWAALGVTDGSEFQLPMLKTLKLRQNYLTDAAINTALAICPNLRRLDLSFTPVRHPRHLLSNSSLEKLSLTSTQVSSADLLKIVSGLTDLKTLALGAMGRGEGSVAASNSTAMTMTDETLRKLTSLLARCEAIENVSLVGNTKLGVVSRTALREFIRQVGRRCKTLNLAGIPCLRSSDLESLPADDINQSRSPLQTLILNNTGIDDNVAPFIARGCDSLWTLEVGGTKLTSEGLDAIVDACTHLQNLNLTSCRGVDVAQRRRFFEAHEERRQQN